MINNLSISGFKCFKSSEFELKNLTVLTGSNGTGKSSLIQALLLTRLAIEKNLQESTSDDYIGIIWKGAQVPLNNGYELKLGSIYDIFNDSSDYNENVIKIAIDGEEFIITLPEDEEKSTSVNFELRKDSFQTNDIPFWRKKEFYYLHTERLGPRLGLDSKDTDFLHCGFKGELTAQVLLKKPFLEIKDQRRFSDIKSNFLEQQTDAWLNLICPGTLGVKVEPQGEFRSQIKLKASAAKKEVLAPNIGFGITYALPIIVNGLVAEKGSIFIVENPEAHLHPKGQSNIGYFLGCVAAAGIKVIIETHSEHVINGLRKAVLQTKNIDPNNVSIYFFNGFENEESIIKIDIKETGDLSKFPRDFFDQVQQDMAELYRIKKSKING